MAFTLDDLVIDRIQMAIAEKQNNGPLLYTLTQLNEATIETTAESKEAKSSDGSLIKKFYQGKAGTFTATNAMINLNVIGAASGTDKIVGSSDNMIEMPKIITVKQGTKTVTLVDGTNETLVKGTIRVNALGNNGAMGKAYTLTTDAASDTAFSVSGNVLTLPTDSTAEQFVVKFDRMAANAVKIINASDKFPGTVKLTLKALAVDPCRPDTLRSCYIIIPSFQVSPELSITLSTEGTLDYKGDMQISYCSPDKELYSVVMCGDDVEDEK